MPITDALISVEEYLRISTDPDCEYVDGVIEERPEGELDHSTWQTILAAYFLFCEKELGIRSRAELRVQVSPTRFRVPDLTILHANAPEEQIITHPPLAVFEIVSPEDTVTRILEKLADYEQMGIGAIWMIEPKKQKYYRYSRGQLTPAELFELPGSTFRVAFDEIAKLAK